MMLRHSLERAVEAAALEDSIHSCWADGILTRDLRADGLGTAAVTEAVCERLRTSAAAWSGS
jgi:isocitrate/isopropylmalate dehydrogenase